MENPVFSIAASVILLLVILGAAIPKSFEEAAVKLFSYTTVNFGWLYLLSVFIIILVLVFLAVGKYGSLRLGPDNELPEFPFFTWIAMLFSAGFGVGLVFWGVAEPMSHFFNSPVSDVTVHTEKAARFAMGYSFFHWGISQWSVFAIVGLVIDFYNTARKKDGLVLTALEPVTGENRR